MNFTCYHAAIYQLALGRFERAGEAPFGSLHQITQEVCNAIVTKGWLHNGVADVPLSVLGYSFGTLQAYECARALEVEQGYTVAHFVSIAGVPFDHLLTFSVNRDDYDADDDEVFDQKLRENLMLTFGYVPDYLNRHHPAFNAEMRAHTVTGIDCKTSLCTQTLIIPTFKLPFYIY